MAISISTFVPAHLSCRIGKSRKRLPPEITLQKIFLAVLPFIGLQIIGLTLVMLFPEIVLVLRRVIGG